MTISTKFSPTWESLQQYEIPDWYADAKFGIFIHWGVYSVPAFANEWYPRNMYLARVRQEQSLPAPRQDLRRAHRVRLQGLHPPVQAPKSTSPGGVGGSSLQELRRPLRRARRGAPRRLSRCTTAPSSRDWTRRATWGRKRDLVGELAQGRARAAACTSPRPLDPSRRALVVHGTAGRTPSIPTCKDPKPTPSFYGPAVQPRRLRPYAAK
jgi:hypothetical protein